MAGFAIKVARRIDHYGKPFLFAEFGMVPDKPDTAVFGIAIHAACTCITTMGAARLRSAGTGMLWWWHNYIDPKDLYSNFDRWLSS